MVAPASTQRVRDAAEPVVATAGLVLEDVAVARAGKRSVVRLVIDLDEDAVGSLDLDTLADVSRDVGTALDDTDAVAGEYTLEVSTPGTSRPLTEPRHFKRARTRLVRLAMVDGSSAFGRLLAVEGDTLVLGPVDPANGRDTTGDPTRVPLADVARGLVEVELSRVTTDDDSDEEA
ncbi:ribosome maturation factor RimP [Cellulomonas sp. ATA003]|uniref:ribosome maturation factor RimP n=1 Tax=Cellulomonas sp. ATA003 TaxID=3073064 RepID=UPI002873E5B0|nr:ribosome maturation factor RimP [Cellulomonas sp. ATA003]WNB84907.1 ribosome maturation factor RimP [Cellulomonas sp. ATA003]